MVKLADIGEFGLINRFSRHFTPDLPAKFVGIGDDCAIIALNKSEALLVTTDMLIEGTHFLLNKIKPFELGYKSLAVNLSDIAAMGGIPEGIFLSIGIPQGIEIEWIDEFFRGLKYLSEKTGTYLLGGDTTKSIDRLVINITVTGKSELKRVKKRSSAQTGDIICVTDFVGDSAGGLKCILNNIEKGPLTTYLIDKHYMPVPHLREGQWLALQKGVNAMIDISDGIASDIRRIIECSEVGAVINLLNLPVSEPLRNVCIKYGWNVIECAASGGEDYCLMATIDIQYFKSIRKKFKETFNKDLYEIGIITKADKGLVFKEGEKSMEIEIHGFDHFKH